MVVDACMDGTEPLDRILWCRAFERGDPSERVEFRLQRITPGQRRIREGRIDLG